MNVPAVLSNYHQVALWSHNHHDNINGPEESHPPGDGRNLNRYDNAIGVMDKCDSIDKVMAGKGGDKANM